MALHAAQPVEEAFIALAQACVRQWQGNVTGAAHADAEQAVEFIHQIRVALRRLRSALKAFAPVLPAPFPETWQQRLRDNADRFGPARDLDVFRTELLMLPAAEQGEGLALAAFARERLARARRRARKRFEAASSLEPAQLHRLRIGMKELRYTLEFFAPLFGHKAVKDSLERITRAQITLGFLQDVAVARSRLEAWTRETPSLALAAGYVLGWHGPGYARLRSRVLDDTRPALWGGTPRKHG